MFRQLASLQTDGTLVDVDDGIFILAHDDDNDNIPSTPQRTVNKTASATADDGNSTIPAAVSEEEFVSAKALLRRYFQTEATLSLALFDEQEEDELHHEVMTAAAPTMVSGFVRYCRALTCFLIHGFLHNWQWTKQSLL